MTKIAILNDEPEVVALMARFLTERGHEFMKLIGDTPLVREHVIAFGPQLILVPIYRAPERVGKPLEDFYRDVHGACMLESIARTPELQGTPLLVFSFSVRLDEIPPDLRSLIRDDAFLLFPEGLQELNPLISGYLGPAGGSLADLRRLTSDVREVSSDEGDA